MIGRRATLCRRLLPPLRLRLPQGAPLLVGLETQIESGHSTYTMPRAWHRECRVFVAQPTDGRVALNECHSNEKGVVRRLEVDGLDHATVTFYPGTEARADNIRAYLNSAYPWLKGRIPFQKGPAAFGACYQSTNITGRLCIAW